MSNKLPTEIYLSEHSVRTMLPTNSISVGLKPLYKDDVKYLSEEYFKEQLGLQEIELNHTKTLLKACEEALFKRDNEIKELREHLDKVQMHYKLGDKPML